MTHITLRDGTVLEHATAAPPLAPGERGVHTNGPAAHWLRLPGGPLARVPAHVEALTRSRVGLRHLIDAADVCDNVADFALLVWGDRDSLTGGTP